MSGPVAASGKTGTPSTVDRFAERARAARRVRRRRVLGVAGAVVLLAAGAVLVYRSGLLAVRKVQVRGLGELSRAEVLRVAAVPIGWPLARLDVDAVRARVARIPRVAWVSVNRQLPGTVRITVAERQRVAVVAAGGGFRAVDVDGVAFASLPSRPRGVPLILRQARLRPDWALRAAVRVLTAMPPELAPRVRVVNVRGPEAIVVGLAVTGPSRLRGGAARTVSVVWGGESDSERKARVLAALLRQPAAVYDVSAPEAPTTRG